MNKYIIGFINITINNTKEHDVNGHDVKEHDVCGNLMLLTSIKSYRINVVLLVVTTVMLVVSLMDVLT
jgi:hypothetical protein